MGDKRYGSDAFDEDAEILVPAAAGTDSITLTSKEPHLATISNMAFPTSSALRTSGKIRQILLPQLVSICRKMAEFGSPTSACGVYYVTCTFDGATSIHASATGNPDTSAVGFQHLYIFILYVCNEQAAPLYC